MPDADVARFDRRAGTYEQGWRAEFHARVVAATAELALRVTPQPQTVLDVGCGTGVLLRTLADQLPVGVELEGVDPAAGMVEVGRDSLAGRASVRIEQAPAEKLPFVDASFDLVISTVSFHHWADRRAGLREVARVLRRGGRLVLADHFAIGWLRVFDFVARRHLPAAVERGYRCSSGRFDLGPLPLIRAVVAERAAPEQEVALELSLQGPPALPLEMPPERWSSAPDNPSLRFRRPNASNRVGVGSRHSAPHRGLDHGRCGLRLRGLEKAISPRRRARPGGGRDRRGGGRRAGFGARPKEVGGVEHHGL